MQRVQTAADRIVNQATRNVETLWRRHEAGTITLDRFRALAAAVLVRANARGVSVADLGLSRELTRNLGRPVRPLGLRPTPEQLDQRRVRDALDTVITGNLDTISDPVEVAESRRRRLAQVARSEPLLTVAATVQVGMQRRNLPGWVRQVDADPCPKCVAWADGVVRPAGTRMARHNGCACIQRPVPYDPGTKATNPASRREWTDWAESPVGQLITAIP